jgi:hypothetical protein
MVKRATLSVLVVALAGLMIGGECTGEKPDADSRQAERTAKSLGEADRQIGMPAIKNFQERKLAKLIFELRDRSDLITYAYIVNLEGELIFIGKCIGFGLPYSVQYTNPERLVSKWIGSSSGTNRRYTGPIPQADPNGLFMPQGLSATWLMMVDPETGKPRPVYIEPEIIVSPFPLK